MSIRLSISFLTVLFAFESSAQITFDLWQQDSFTARIAYSADGNYNDEDDWASSPMALAIFAEFSVQSNLVHFDYNCILPKSNSAWEREHTTSITGAIEHFEYNPDIFYDCQTDLDGAINSIARAIDASSADNPLFFILAGPMEVPYMGIARSSPEKRKYVYCISHNRWNDGYASADLVDHNKRDVIPTGITWVQIRDQNPLLTTSPFGRPSNEAEWEPWQWLRNSDNKKLNFLWERLRVSTRGDCSDAGMAYFLMTGDEQADLAKLRALLEGHEVPSPFLFRDQIRLEAENFTTLEDLDVDFVNNREVSQRISVKSKSHQSRLSTLIREPYMIDHGTYHIDIRYSISLSSPVQIHSQDRWLADSSLGRPYRSRLDNRNHSTDTAQSGRDGGNFDK